MKRLLPPIEDLEALSRRLDEALDRQALALDACGAGIWDWDIDSGKLYWDATTRRMFGVTVFGGGYADFERCVEPADALQVEAHLQHAILTHTPFDLSFRLTSRPGVVVSGKGKCYYVRGKAARFIGINVEESNSRPPVCPIAYASCPARLTDTSYPLQFGIP